MKKETALRILLALVGLAHLALGLIANLAPPETLVKIVSESYGATIEVTPQAHHVVRILGAFMIGIGVMAMCACLDPRRNKAIIMGIITILVLRVIQRVVLAQEISSSFHISSLRLWGQAAFFLIIAIALFVLRTKPAPASPAPASPG
jgi:hypothetical protein